MTNDLEADKTWTPRDTRWLATVLLRCIPRSFTGEIWVKLKEGGIADMCITLPCGGFRREKKGGEENGGKLAPSQ